MFNNGVEIIHIKTLKCGMNGNKKVPLALFEQTMHFHGRIE